MSYKFTKLSDVLSVSELPEDANAIIESNGEIRRAPSSSAASEWISSNGENVLSHLSDNIKHITEIERDEWNNKQDKLIAGDNITISEDGKTISAIGGSVQFDWNQNDSIEWYDNNSAWDDPTNVGYVKLFCIIKVSNTAGIQSIDVGDITLLPPV